MAYTQSYTYLGVTFIGPQFSLREANCARLLREYAAFGALKGLCARIQFQEPASKFWQFNILVTPTPLQGL